MSAEKIISSWKKNDFKPVYWLQGEEEYYIDQVINYAEHSILPESESAFNLTIFYGRDADWAGVLNACKRYPMFAEKQVVVLKEAQHMKDIEKLEAYVESPLSSTIFVVAYKGKTLDKRTKLSKLIASKAELFNSAKIRDEKIPEWISDLVKNKGFNIKPKSVSLLAEHIGNDLNRISNEIDKLTINLGTRTTIDEDDIEKYIGISKEYNIFELLAAISKKDLPKAITIINFFESNPKAVPIQLALPALYAQFSKVYAVYGMNDKSEAALKPFFYYNPSSVKQAQDMMKNYGYNGMEKLILLLHQYNLKGIGVGDSGTAGPSLIKEMVVKMMVD